MFTAATLLVLGPFPCLRLSPSVVLLTLMQSFDPFPALKSSETLCHDSSCPDVCQSSAISKHVPSLGVVLSQTHAFYHLKGELCQSALQMYKK